MYYYADVTVYSRFILCLKIHPFKFVWYFSESFLLNISLYWWICWLIFGETECVNNEYYKPKKAE